MTFVKSGYDRVSSQPVLYILLAYLTCTCLVIRLKRNLDWGGGNSTSYKTLIPNSKIFELSLFGQICKTCP